MIEVFCSGFRKDLTGEGGYGVIVLDGNTVIQTHREYSAATLTDRENLKALLWGLNYVRTNNFQYMATIYSDSANTVNTFNKWMYEWAKNHWQGAAVVNTDLVQELYEFAISSVESYQVRRYKKGCNNILGKELADAVAKNNDLKFNNLVKTFNLDIREGALE